MWFRLKRRTRGYQMEKSSKMDVDHLDIFSPTSSSPTLYLYLRALARQEVRSRSYTYDIQVSLFHDPVTITELRRVFTSSFPILLPVASSINQGVPGFSFGLTACAWSKTNCPMVKSSGICGSWGFSGWNSILSFGHANVVRVSGERFGRCCNVVPGTLYIRQS